nr:MAG TPA_asm: ParB protein [Caudoviricetes sp.]
MGKIMDVKNIPIKEIVPYAQNAKKHDKRQIDNVAQSIRQYGFV